MNYIMYRTNKTSLAPEDIEKYTKICSMALENHVNYLVSIGLMNEKFGDLYGD
jgi:hypothetical protein